MSAQDKPAHGHWSSRNGFLLAAVGSAVGLGNIWKFPYMVGQSGGAAFVAVYLVCIALIGVPIIVAEWMIGRRGQENPINSMADVAVQSGRSKGWVWVGVTGTLAGFLILSFYSVIGGWALNYLAHSASGDFGGISKEAADALFTGLLGDAGTLLAWHSVFIAVTIGIVALGVSGGIERASKILMPSLAVLLVLMVGYGATSGGFGAALEYLFAPDFSKLTGEVLIAALSHAFFTLSLGMGIMIAYGSYLGEDVDLLSAARTVAIMDTAIALLAGLAIFPIVFANGLDPAAGPGLIFVTLPLVFGQVTAGGLVGTIFFVLLTFAAITSAISLLEPSVALLEERTPLGRVPAALVAGGVVWALGIAALLSFNEWSDVLIFGFNIFDLLDNLTGKILLPITALGAILFVGWRMDLNSVHTELGLGSAGKTMWNVVARFVAPIGLIVVFITSL